MTLRRPGYIELWVVRRARRGLRPQPRIAGVCAELVSAGMVKMRRGVFGRRLYATGKGGEALVRAAHSRDRVARAIAAGMFDHVPVGLMEQLVASPQLERYIESQRQVQRLILLQQLAQRW